MTCEDYALGTHFSVERFLWSNVSCFSNECPVSFLFPPRERRNFRASQVNFKKKKILKLWINHEPSHKLWGAELLNWLEPLNHGITEVESYA